MKRSSGLSFLCLILIFSLFAQADEFSWDLADKKATLRDWEIISGDWEFEDGWWDVRSTAIEPGIALIKESVARQFGIFTHDGMICEVTFEAFIDRPWRNQFIVFAYAPDTDEDHVYQAGQRVGDREWSIERMDIAIPWRAWMEEEFRVLNSGAQGSDVVVPDREYSFKLEIDGDTIITYSNNREQMRFTFGEDRPKIAILSQIKEMPVGRIGISNDNARTRFRNFRISGPDVRPVEPAGKLTTTWGSLKRRDP